MPIYTIKYSIYGVYKRSHYFSFFDSREIRFIRSVFPLPPRHTVSKHYYYYCMYSQRQADDCIINTINFNSIV